VLDGAAKIDAVRRLVKFQLTIPGLLTVAPSASTKPLQVVLPAVLHWLSVSPLVTVVTSASRLSLAANIADATLTGNRPVHVATLQRMLAVVAGLLHVQCTTAAGSLATTQEAAQFAAGWQPRTIRLLAQASSNSKTAVDDSAEMGLDPSPATSDTAPAKAEVVPWTYEVEPSSTASVKPGEPVRSGHQGLCLFYSVLHDIIAPFPALQSELVSNLCAVPEPSLLGIVWGVLTTSDNISDLLAAAATRTLGSHPLLRPLMLFLRMGLLVYTVLQDVEILGDGQKPCFPLPLVQLGEALNLLNQIAFRILWDGDGLAFPTIDREVCDRCIQLLRVLHSVDERARASSKEVMPELWWRIGNSKLSKLFETELIRRSSRAVAIATRMPHLPKRSAAQRLAAAESRRAAFKHQSDPRSRSEALRLQGLEAAARVDFQTALQCYCAALEIDGRNFLALANRSAVLVRAFVSSAVHNSLCMHAHAAQYHFPLPFRSVCDVSLHTTYPSFGFCDHSVRLERALQQ
jgi:hypothetical protein